VNNKNTFLLSLYPQALVAMKLLAVSKAVAVMVNPSQKRMVDPHPLHEDNNKPLDYLESRQEATEKHPLQRHTAI
jgi:hypothetical protein